MQYPYRYLPHVYFLYSTMKVKCDLRLKAGFLLGSLASSMFGVSDGNHTLLWPQHYYVLTLSMCVGFHYYYYRGRRSSKFLPFLLAPRFLPGSWAVHTWLAALKTLKAIQCNSDEQNSDFLAQDFAQLGRCSKHSFFRRKHWSSRFYKSIQFSLFLCHYLYNLAIFEKSK